MFLHFWVFGFLQLCFQSVEADRKFDSEKDSVCVGIYSVFKGCACRRGVTIYVYIHVYIYVYTYTYVYLHIYTCICICVCMYITITRT